MVENPEKYVTPFADAGADLFNFHLEACPSEESILALISRVRKETTMKVGITIKPKTPASAISDSILSAVDMVLVMTVEPGFGGQSFMRDMLPKVAKLRKRRPDLMIQVDGGVSPETAYACGKAGANVAVAGSAVFKAKDRKLAVETIKKEIQRGLDE
eukprot:gnl/Carplike_NY0171/3382_a4552_481.p1 GENE.gnl/Carplike_NY0171/3382_a4552_481~~gnl/Carplike_NY0171/3382_a4552_481.p1  ORF type:complete len:158 (+),score=29.32 gnl/Carplike_NY0171/3382_a4552_481:245-718(+)